MIEYETFCRLRQLHDEKGLKVSQIAAELDLDPKTVERWIDQPTYRPRQCAARRPSKLDSFRGQIAALLERHPYTAQQLLQQLRQQGYAGGYSILKEFVRQVRPVRKPAFLMLEFAPGECAQVDWGNFGSIAVGSTRRRLSFFVMVLCYSRMMYVEFTLSEGIYASQKLTLKLYPDQLLFFHNEKLIATHPRSYDRGQKVRNPDHLKELVTQRKKARDQTLLLTFLALSSHAEPYARMLEDKRLNAQHHIQKIVALSEIYGPEKVDRAIQDAIEFQACGCEYIANILEQRQRPAVTPGALHLTRRQDLLDLDLPPADLTPYEPKQNS